MEHIGIFQDSTELRRLAVQNRLLREYEQPVYRRLLDARQGAVLLDVGCNDGSKTADRFSCEPISRVLGLEYDPELVRQANARYGGGRFVFRQCDAEDPDFAGRLRALMEPLGIPAFDLIHVSFVLLHLKDPAAVLSALRGVLAPGGALVIVETNDSASRLTPDPDGLLDRFLAYLDRDPFSGDRSLGARLPELLRQTGFRDIVCALNGISVDEADRSRKADIFDTFFSYLPEDVKLLLAQGRQEFAPCSVWLEENYDALRRLILAEDSRFFMGFTLITCKGE